MAAGYDPISHTLPWHFTSVDPATGQPQDDPLVGFLPPNTDGNGQGSVFFTVMPKPGLASGTAINNQAIIYFDLNDGIPTNRVLNTVDNTAPQSAVTALPAQEPGAQFLVAWGGTDAHSGIADYTVYVSRDNGPYGLWLANTTETSATFFGLGGHDYKFYSVARDAAGNEEVAPSDPDATTHTTMVLYLPIMRK